MAMQMCPFNTSTFNDVLVWLQKELLHSNDKSSERAAEMMFIGAMSHYKNAPITFDTLLTMVRIFGFTRNPRLRVIWDNIKSYTSPLQKRLFFLALLEVRVIRDNTTRFVNWQECGFSLDNRHWFDTLVEVGSRQTFATLQSTVTAAMA